MYSPRKKVMSKSSSIQKGYKLVKRRCKQKFASKVKVTGRTNRHKCKVTYWKNRKREDEGPLQYSVYCIVNSGFFKSKGSLVASVARGFLELYNKMALDRIKVKYLDFWEESGEKLMILKGINHKHLEYLAEELSYAAVGINSYYKTWSRNKVLLVLSVLGKEEDVEELVEGLSELR